MKRSAKLMALSVFLFGAVALIFTAEASEEYPSKPVIMTSAFAPGGSTDLTVRAIAAVAPKYFSQPIISMPKPGGAGLIALQNLASSKPDGYTLHLGRTAEMSIAPAIQRMPFKMETDFIPIAQIATDWAVFSVNAGAPWNTIEELIAAAKKEPGKIKYAVSSPAALSRIALESFCDEFGISLTMVPFKGAQLAAVAVVGGHIPVLTCMTRDALPHVKGGKIRVLLAFTEKRIKEYPDVPSAKEKGAKFVFGAYSTVFAPKGVPPSILSKIEDLLKEVAKDPDFVDKCTKIGGEPEFIPGKDFRVSWEKELVQMKAIVKRLGLEKKP